MKRFFDLVSDIDRMIQEAPIPERVNELCRIVSDNPEVQRYVFQNLSRADWLAPLDNNGMFTDSVNNSVVGLKEWPQADYLKRMAMLGDIAVQKRVLGVILESELIDDYYCHVKFLDAVLAMPADLAARWTEKEIKWLSKNPQLPGGLGELIGKLVSKLSVGQKHRSALRLASKLLDVLPDPGAKEKKRIRNKIKKLIQGSLEPATRCDRYNYEQVLSKNIPDLARVAPHETLKMLCSLLEKAVVCSQREGAKNKPQDATFVWRPAIEDHEQNKDYKIDCPLITAVRDTAEGICKQNPDEIRKVVAAVENHGWNIFRRISLHLLRVMPSAPIEMVESRLVSKELFDTYDCHHEYYHLLSEKFRDISGVGQKQILHWIEQGEDLDDRDDLTPERRAQRTQQWQYRILTAIKADLPKNWKSIYADLEVKFGQPSIPPDFKSYSSVATWRGPQSPKKADELALMCVADLIAFVKEWKPSGEWMSPTPDGLGAAIGELVAQQPERFIADIGLFMDPEIGPTYIRHMIAGFCRVVESEKPIPYDAVFKLCHWVLERRDDSLKCDLSAELKDGIDVDRSWRLARSEVVRFAEKSLGEKAQLPFILRRDVFDIIKPLTDDPQPDEKYEKKSNSDPLSISLNTIRGKALHALMTYAMWVNRNIKAGENRRPDFGDMPEVQAILDKHLDPSVDPSRATRAVYGQWLPQLVYLGPDWVTENMPRLFPGDPELKPLREAAWHTYLIYGGRLYSSVAKKVMSLYREEVMALKNKPIAEKSYESPEHRLAEHVVVMYLWREFELESDSLIDLLFKMAPPAITTHVIDFIGRDIFRNEDVKKQIITRMQALWEWRVRQAGGFVQMALDELSAFGWWFASKEFDAEWALRNLEETLKRTHINAANLQAIERLSDLYVAHPAEVLRCLRLFVDVNSDPWFFASSRKQKGVWTILQHGMASDNAAIRDQAEEIVHLLGSKGFLEFRELISKKREQK